MDATTMTYRDNPAGYGDFGALIGEDEQGGEEGGFVLDGLLEEAEPGMCVVTGATRVQFGGRVVLFKGTEGEVCECEIEECEGQREKIDS